MDEDHLLVERFQAGDRKAFDALVRLHYRRAYNLAFRILGDSEKAADATQAAFVRVYKGLPNYRYSSAFTTWLYRVVVNVSLDLARRAGRSATVPLESAGDDHLSPAEQLADDETQDPAASLLRAERARAVQATLLSLPPLYRAVLVLYELQGLTYDQIGDVLGIPVGTVKSRLNRARQAFARKFAQHLELFGLGEGQTRRENEDDQNRG